MCIKKKGKYLSIRRILALIISLFVLQLVSCKKFIEVEAPITSINSGLVYKDDKFAAAVLTGIYADITSNTIRLGGLLSLSFFPGMSSDELKLHSLSNATNLGYYSNGLTNSISQGADFWTSIYKIVFKANVAIEGLNASEHLIPAVKRQLLGEAKFMRALCYFYLVNLYGDVPLVINTNYEQSRLLARTPQSQVYEQILSDLKEAQELLSDYYLQADALTAYAIGSEERVRPTKWAASALLARVYLYTSDWENAEKYSTSTISNMALFDTVYLDGVFLKNSKEAIWQLQATRSDPLANTQEGWLFVLRPSGPGAANPVYLSAHLINSFEIGDLRRQFWTRTIIVGGNSYTHPYKYKKGQEAGAINTEYSMVLRLGEQYLIRAEARAHLDNISGAQADLNIIRSRAGLSNTSVMDKHSLLEAILNERRVELFTEWGHRWFDIKRTGKVNTIMSNIVPQKVNGATWRPFQQYYPIRISELSLNPNLTQTEGY